MAEHVIELTDNTFDEQVGSSATPILVDFWAEWCGPCKKVAPVLEEISNEQVGRITIAKLNIDDNPAIAQRYGIMTIPTLLLFKDGEIAQTIVGAKGKSQLLTELEAHL